MPTAIGLGNGLAFGQGAGLLPQTQTFIAAMMTPPSTVRAALINNYFQALLSASIWNKLDILYLLAAADSQAARLNAKNPAVFTCIDVGAGPTFTADRGFAGNGTTTALNTQFTPSSNGVNYVQNNASVWEWSLTDATSVNADVGSAISASIYVQPLLTGTGTIVRINDNTSSSASNSTSLGMFGATRPDSNTKRIWQNGAQLGTDFSVASVGIEASAQWICGRNSSQFSTHQIAFAAWGANLTSTEVAAFYTATLIYMEGVGAVSP
jgi:hypothetical protein